MWREPTGNIAPFLSPRDAGPPWEHSSCQNSSNFLCSHRESQLEHSSCALVSLPFWIITLSLLPSSSETFTQIQWIRKYSHCFTFFTIYSDVGALLNGKSIFFSHIRHILVSNFQNKKRNIYISIETLRSLNNNGEGHCCRGQLHPVLKPPVVN